jgi:hypothetical protein
MAGQLCWQPGAERDGERVLHFGIADWLFLKPTASLNAGNAND